MRALATMTRTLLTRARQGLNAVRPRAALLSLCDQAYQITAIPQGDAMLTRQIARLRGVAGSRDEDAPLRFVMHGHHPDKRLDGW